MQINLFLPNVELNMESVTVTGWLVSVGELVAAEQAILEVETQKATIEVAAPAAGYVRELYVSAGDEIGEKALLCVLTDAPDGAFEDPRESFSTESPAAATETTSAPAAVPESDIVPAAPAARRLAKELEVDLYTVKGTGPNGRVTVEDVQAASAATGALPARQAGGEWTPLPPTRIALNAQMQRSLAEIPQINVARQIDVTPLLRKQEGVTFTHRLVLAAAKALTQHPALLTRIEDNKVKVEPVSVAIAMDTPHGLVAPVIRQADSMSLEHISSAMKSLQAKAAANSLTRQDMADGPFAITNLGMFGVDFFQPFVFHGQTAVLAVARAVDAAGERKVAWFSLATDHRVVDGAAAARFLQTLQDSILQEA